MVWDKFMKSGDTIFYIGGFELPDKNAAAQRVIGNAKAFRDLGYNVIFLDIDRTAKKSVLETKSSVFGFECYSMQYENKRLINISDFLAVMQKYESKITSVIAYNYPGIALWKIMRYCKKNGIKIIADCTEWYGIQGDNLIKKCIKGVDSYIRMNIVQPQLDGIIVISRFLENYYSYKLPTVCIPPLTDLSDEKWVSESPDNHNGIRIVYAGSPGKNKDKINLIVEAFVKSNTPDSELIIIGITQTQFLEYYPEDKWLVSELNQRVKFMGLIPHEQVIHILKQADFSMFYRDITRITMAGFPTKFSESISCGTPVITNRTSNLAEYLHDGVNGYWIDDDISEVLNKILSSNNSKNIILKHSIDRSIFDYRKFISFFDSFISNIIGENK